MKFSELFFGPVHTRRRSSSAGFRSVCDAGAFASWMKHLKGKSGAYIIKQKSKVLYVGESHTGNLAKTLKRHFYPWRDDPERKHHVYDPAAVLVRVRVTPAKHAVRVQNGLIARLNPRDNGTNPAAKNPF